MDSSGRITHALDLASAISKLFADFGSPMTEAAFRQATKECRDDIYKDTLAHGGRIEEPFFNFVISNDVAVFTFFETDFSVYAIRCNASDLISETNQFAMSETEECKAFLATRYQKSVPDVAVSRTVCEQWLDG